jgi:hypothetical protein
MPRTASTDIHTLVEAFTTELSQVMRRAAFEEVHAKLSLVIGDVAPQRRGPGRPRKAASATAAVPRRRKGGKRTAADLGEMRDALLAHVKANPGARGEQIAAALGTDVGTMRLPMRKLIAERLVRTQGQRRGMTYYAGAGKAKRAAPKRKRAARKARRAKPARKNKAAKRRKPAAPKMLMPHPRRTLVQPEPAATPSAPEPVTTEAS